MTHPILDHGDVPTLELTIDYAAPLLMCVGTVDATTRHHVLEAVEELLDRRPTCMTVDVRSVEAGDSAGAATFELVRRRAREAGTRLEWVGLDHGDRRGTVAADEPPGRVLLPATAGAGPSGEASGTRAPGGPAGRG
jgi:anti-anti-sigma regulatory factor